MKNLREYIYESKSFLNREITPDNFDTKNFTSEEAKIIKDLLKNYKPNMCWLYLVDGKKIPENSNIKQYFGEIVPKNKKGILYIERDSIKMGAQEYAKLYETK